MKHWRALVPSLLLAAPVSAAQITIQTLTVPNLPPSPSNPTGDDWSAIQNTFDQVSASSPTVVRFLAGQYDVYSNTPLPTEKRQPLVLDGVNNVTIRGAANGGTTLVFHGFEPNAPSWESSQQPNHAYPRQIFSFDHVNTLKVERLTVKMAREPYSIGKVVSQTTMGDIRSVVLQMDQDYLDLADGFRIQRVDDFQWSAPRRLRGQRFSVILNDGDYTTTVFRPGGGQMPQVTVSNTAASVGSWFHTSLGHDLIGPLGAYDSGLVLMHSKYNCAFIQANHCGSLTVRNLTVQDMPGMGVIAWNSHNVTIDDFDLEPQPGRLLSITADGVHLKDCSGDVLVENCDMKSQGDDGFNVHSQFLQVASPLPAGGNALVLDEVNAPYYGVEWAPGGIQEGVEFFAPDLTRRGNAALVGFARIGISTQFDATFASGYPAGVAPLDFVCNTDKAPRSVIVRGCLFEGNISRGVAAHGPNVVVTDCTFRSNTGPAIMLETELLSYFEARPGDGLFVDGCTIDDSNRHTWSFLGAITVAGINSGMSSCDDASTGIAAAGLHHDIRIEDTVFTNLGNDVGNRKAAIWVTSTDYVHFARNEFSNIGFATTGCAQNILRLENSTNASSSNDNQVLGGFPTANWFTFVNSTLSGSMPTNTTW